MDVFDLNDEYVCLAQEAVEGISRATVPGVYWVEHFPFLRHIPSWVPGTSSRKMTEHYKPIAETMRDKPFDQIKQAVVGLNPNPTLLCSVSNVEVFRQMGMLLLRLLQT